MALFELKVIPGIQFGPGDLIDTTRLNQAALPAVYLSSEVLANALPPPSGPVVPDNGSVTPAKIAPNFFTTLVAPAGGVATGDLVWIWDVSAGAFAVTDIGGLATLGLAAFGSTTLPVLSTDTVLLNRGGVWSRAAMYDVLAGTWRNYFVATPAGAAPFLTSVELMYSEGGVLKRGTVRDITSQIVVGQSALSGIDPDADLMLVHDADEAAAVKLKKVTVRQAIDSVITPGVSGDIPVNSLLSGIPATHSYAHGFPAVPRKVRWVYKILTAENGFSVGTEIDLDSFPGQFRTWATSMAVYCQRTGANFSRPVSYGQTFSSNFALKAYVER
jgi:hypothetical protein